MDFGGGEEIRFERIGRAGVVTLTRPKALNAVTHGMVRALSAALDAWRDDDAVALVILRGEGRAFSAGGDIIDIYEAGRAGRPPFDFFADEYRLNAAIHRYPKPYVSLIDGIVMGGGVGISINGSHRVFTENGIFAMPEVGIGFFPDVGATRILSSLPGEFGTYLGLTGNRIRWGDALWSGIASHCVETAALEALVAEACETGDIDAALASRVQEPPRETDDATLHLISRHFSPESVTDIVASLKTDVELGDEFARATLDTMLARSPTSLHVARQQIATGPALDMDECMIMEYRIVSRMLTGHDFYEGIRALLIDKGSKPAWQPASLEEVGEEEIEAYFAPLPDGDLRL